MVAILSLVYSFVASRAKKLVYIIAELTLFYICELVPLFVSSAFVFSLLIQEVQMY